MRSFVEVAKIDRLVYKMKRTREPLIDTLLLCPRKWESSRINNLDAHLCGCDELFNALGH